MAIGRTGVTELSSLFNNIYEDAVFVARDQNLATRLVQVFTNGAGDQTRTRSDYPEVSFVSVAETEDFSAPTKFDKTQGETLTPAELMAQGILTDRRRETDPQDAYGDLSTELGMAAAKKVDVDILSNFSSLTGGTVGASGSTMTWGYLFAAQSILRANNVPGPYAAVLHPYAWHYMAEASAPGATVTNSPQFQDDILRQWYVGSVAGMDIFFSTNVPTSGTDAYSAVFNRQALAFDLRRDFRLEPERDASARQWELNATMLYAHGVWRPNWGVQIIHDATTVS